jgi:hypothetical protein
MKESATHSSFNAVIFVFIERERESKRERERDRQTERYCFTVVTLEGLNLLRPGSSTV